MEDKKNMDTPELKQEMWSPDIMFGDYASKSGTGLTSTPYVSDLPPFSKRLEDSAGSSKQDSGYCSLTPRSAESVGVKIDKRCCLCNKFLHNSYTVGTPESMLCCCKISPNGNNSSNVECMETIPEIKMAPTPKILSRVRLNRPFGLYEEVMDTSLYPEDMEIGDHLHSENHQCSLDFAELGEEKSIDFVEPNVLAVSHDLPKEISICLPTSLPTHAGVAEESKQQDCKLLDSEKDDFFSPEADIFTYDVGGLVSLKSKHELTPTKMKKGSPQLRMKKSTGSSFQSSAKKVTMMNHVIRLFHLNGVEKVDFFYQLGVKKHFPIVIRKILSFLPEKDLDSVRVVSKTWNKILCNDFPAFNRWQVYKTTWRMMKENLASPTKAVGRNRAAPFCQLQNVTNQTSPTQNSSPQHQPFSPPVSPSSARFHSFQRAARSLQKDERLLPCPKCYFASTDRGSPIVQCPRSGCRHRFCVWCRNEVFHNTHHRCPPLYTPRSLTRKSANKVPSIGSKSSKRNLRRL